jgi:hypothetical protein
LLASAARSMSAAGLGLQRQRPHCGRMPCARMRGWARQEAHEGRHAETLALLQLAHATAAQGGAALPPAPAPGGKRSSRSSR